MKCYTHTLQFTKTRLKDYSPEPTDSDTGRQILEVRGVMLQETLVEAVKGDRRIFWFSLQVERAVVLSAPQISKRITKNKTSNRFCFSLHYIKCLIQPA